MTCGRERGTHATVRVGNFRLIFLSLAGLLSRGTTQFPWNLICVLQVQSTGIRYRLYLLQVMDS